MLLRQHGVAFNRSEVVGRPLAALLANDGARVFSVDIDSIQEYTKRPVSSDMNTAATERSYHPHHVARPSQLNLEQCLALSDVIVSAVPSTEYKVRTEWLKDGCICVNVAAEKNFEANVREKAGFVDNVDVLYELMLGVGFAIYTCSWQDDYLDASSEPVRVVPGSTRER